MPSCPIGAKPLYEIRPLGIEDAQALTDLINFIIARGGTTSYETAFSPESFLHEFMKADDVHSCRVAWNEEMPVGFQALFFLDEIDAPNLGVGTFSDQRARYPGVGQALFKHTEAAARSHGAEYIRATIRADNVSGLRYYRGLGFRDHAIRPAVPLRDGTPMDRIETRYPLRCVTART